MDVAFSAAPEAAEDDAEGDGAVEIVDPETGEVVLVPADEAAAAEELAPVDPLEAFREEMAAAPGDWYVIHSYAGYENKVKANLLTRATSLNMEDYIFQVEVPIEEVVEIKNGQKKQVKRNKFPGYVLVRMELTDESWGTVRHTPGVTGFVGHAHQPLPLSLEEVVAILAPEPEAVVEPISVGQWWVGRPAGRGQGREGRRDRPLAGRLGHGHRRCLRHAARHRVRDQHRGPEDHRPGGDLRSRDPGRAAVRPDREELAPPGAHRFPR